MSRTSGTDNDMLGELRDELKDLNLALKDNSKTNAVFTRAFLILALVQFLVSIFQLIMSFAFSDNSKSETLGIFMVISAGVMFFYFMKKVFSK